MQGTVPARIARSGDESVIPRFRTGALLQRRAEIGRQALVKLTLLSADVLLAFLVWGTVFALQSTWGGGPLSEIVLSSVAVWVGIRALLGLYPGYGLDQVEELRRQTYAALAALGITTTFAAAVQIGSLLSGLLIGLGFVGLLLLAPLMRQFVKQLMMKVGLWGKPVVVLSSGEFGEHIVQLLTREWGLGFRPVVFRDYPSSARARFKCVPDEKNLADAKSLSRKHGVDTIVFAIPHTRRERVVELAAWARTCFQKVIIVPNLEGVMNSVVTARDLSGIFGVEIRHNLLNPWSWRVKRALDLLGAVVGGLAICPLLIVIAILIKLDSEGPIFFSQHRVGAQGKQFRCWKFRTMATDAERLLEEYLQSDPNLRAEWEQSYKLRYDPRITRVGRFLRTTSLDELPQLWNVFRGEMSLVGPRPIIAAEVARYGKTYELYKQVKPGISGLWQVSGRNDTSYANQVAFDSYYVRNWSIWIDLVVLVRTVPAVLLSRGAY